MPRHATQTSFKAGDNHRYWKGGTSDYWRREARKIINCPKGLVVHHIDGNWKNNNKSNLMITTQNEHIKIHNKGRKGSFIKSSLKWVLQNKIMELTSKGYSSRKIAEMLDIGKTTVLRSRRLGGN